MPFIDDRGRVFGRINLIDALVLLFVVLLIPLAYGTALLFRAPNPRITAIEPAQVVERSNVRLRMTGQDLRPFLRARIGLNESEGFLVESPTVAEIRMPPLRAGTYDVALFDEARELARMPNAVTVVPPSPPPSLPPSLESSPPPRIELQVVGAFVGITAADANRLTVGAKFDLRGSADVRLGAEVLAVRPAEPGIQRVRVGPADFILRRTPGQLRLPAVIRVSCVIVAADDYCKVGDTSIAPGVRLALTRPRSLSGSAPKSGMPTDATFLIDAVRPPDEAPVLP